MQIRTVLKSLIFPHPAVIAILSITVFPLNCLVLLYEKEEQWYAPVVFFFSFYTLLILSICIARNIRRLIYSFQRVNLFLNNRKRKAIISLRIYGHKHRIFDIQVIYRNFVFLTVQYLRGNIFCNSRYHETSSFKTYWKK